jgi:hypothetical protein
MFGLDPRAATLVVIVDLLVFGGDAATLGAMVPVGVGAGVALSCIVFKIQRHWYGDDRESALIKGLTAGLLTAIPIPLAAVLAVPGGILGLAGQLTWRSGVAQDPRSRNDRQA